MTTAARARSSALATVLAGLIALSASVAGLRVQMVAASVLVVQVLIATAPSLGDSRGRSVPTPRFLPAITAGLVASGLAVFPGVLGRDAEARDVVGLVDTGAMFGVMPAVAIAVVITALTQMLRRDGRRELVAASSYAVSLAATSALAASWIGAVQSLAAPESVIVGAAGLAAGLLVWALPGDRYVLGGAAVLAGAAAGAAVPLVLTSFVTPLYGVAVGGAVAAFAIVGQVMGRAWLGGRSHAAAGWGFPAALAVALAGPVVYVGGQLAAGVLS